MVTDAHLIAGSQAEPERFAELFDRHHDRIAAYLRRRLPRAEADDLAAETFLKAFEGRHGYDPGRPDAAPWLYGIATNLVRRHHRSEGRRWRAHAAQAAGELTGLRAGVGVEADARMDAAAAGPGIVRALEHLKAGDRDALLLLAWGDLAYAEIATALDIPLGTVRSRINRARRLLVAELGLPGPASVDAADGGSPAPDDAEATSARLATSSLSTADLKASE